MKIGYRVVPEALTHQRYEIIVEPWDFETNRKKPGKKKRTGYVFTQYEVNKPGDSPYQKKLREIQLKLINHINQKKSHDEQIHNKH